MTAQRPVFAVLLGALLGAGAPAAADPARPRPWDEEARALRAELDMLLGEAAFRGADADYRALVRLAEKGVALLPDDHLRGARAALGLGDPTLARRRVQEALAGSAPLPAAASLAEELDRALGPVSLRPGPTPATRRLSARDTAPSPWSAAALAAAQRNLDAGQPYVGLLAAGSYTFAGQEIQVSPAFLQQAPTVASGAPAPAPPSGLDGGLWFGAGPALLALGWEPGAPGPARPAGSTWLGADLRLGGAWAPRPRLWLDAEALVLRAADPAGPTGPARPADGPVAAPVHPGWSGAGAALTVGTGGRGRSVSFGPAWRGGTATTLLDACAGRADCPAGWSVVRGRVSAWGATAAVRWAPHPRPWSWGGRGAALAFHADISLLTDGSRALLHVGVRPALVALGARQRPAVPGRDAP